MMNLHSTRRWAENRKKVQYLAVSAFLLCTLLVRPAHAASNTVSGTVYGAASAVATATTIASVEDGASDLLIAHDGTTSLTLSHEITGFINITNQASSFTVNATGANITSTHSTVFAARNATNLTLIGGRFIGTIGAEGGSGNAPPLPGLEESSGGSISNSMATIIGSEFAGGGSAAGFVMEQSTLTISNGTFRGGNTGGGLIALDRSSVTIHEGSFTGGVGNTAFFLQDSDATVYGGTFDGNLNGTSAVLGDGLFSILTDATTNHVDLLGGDFSSLAFYGVEGSVQHFLAGTNLIVRNGIVQNGGTVVIDNQNSDALNDILILSGTMAFPSNTFTLLDGGSFILDGQDSRATFSQLNVASNATMNIGVASIIANTFIADSFSSNILAITSAGNGLIDTQTAYFKTNSVLQINLSGAGVSSIQTNNYALISADTDQIFAGATTNTNADAESFKENVNIETTSADRTRFVDLFFETTNGNTVILFQFTAQALSEYWGLSNGISSVVSEEFANELDLLASSEMLAIIDSFGSSVQSLAAVEEAYFTTMNTFQTALQGLQAAVGQSVSRGAEFREQLKLIPPGAKGPPRKNDLRGWVKYYGQFYSHNADGLNRQYDTTLHGGVGGIDKSIGNLLLGISGGVGNYRTTDSTESEETIDAFHGALYGTYGTQRAYFDAGIAYGHNQVETKTGGAFTLLGEFDAQVISAYFGGGYDLIDTEGGTVFSPEASIQYSLYEQDAYSETSDNAVPRNIDAFDASSLRSSIGLNLSTLNTTAFETFGFKLDGRIHWLHEFNSDPGSMAFSLEGGSGNYQLATPLLDEEIFRAGFGFTFFNILRNKPKNVLFRFDFDELFGNGFYSHNLSAKVIYAF